VVDIFFYRQMDGISTIHLRVFSHKKADFFPSHEREGFFPILKLKTKLANNPILCDGQYLSTL
jgi:hypothetical protein